MHTTSREAQQRALIHSLREAYLEVFPASAIAERLRILPPNSFVAITCSPSKGVGPTLDLAERLVASGLRVVPHVAAKMVRDEAHLDQILRRLDGLGIDCLFVPGGDAAKPLGAFATAFELLRAIAERPHKLREIGVAGHPEGHPAVGRDVLMRELERKQPYATYLVTQMCFDAPLLGGWLAEIRGRGVTLPAWLGLPGEAERSSLLRTALRLGVGDSLRYLRHNVKVASHLLAAKTYRPDALLRELAPWIADPELRVAGHHIFCFNQVESTERWRHKFIAELESGVSSPPMAFTLSSPDFAPGGEIPAHHTCEGADLSPTLVWSGAPAGSKSFALIVDDPDAPDPEAPRMTWVHWVLYDLLPGT
ncbi:MAG: methylenetetrahydrofolate reductase, partial [Gammaproteobacteria bacterium]